MFKHFFSVFRLHWYCQGCNWCYGSCWIAHQLQDNFCGSVSLCCHWVCTHTNQSHWIALDCNLVYTSTCIFLQYVCGCIMTSCTAFPSKFFCYRVVGLIPAHGSCWGCRVQHALLLVHVGQLEEAVRRHTSVKHQCMAVEHQCMVHAHPCMVHRHQHMVMVSGFLVTN